MTGTALTLSSEEYTASQARYNISIGMDMVTPGKAARVFIAPSLLCTVSCGKEVHSFLFIEQVLKCCKRRVIALLAMTAILYVQILTTFNAKTFAIRVMQGLDRDF